MDSKTESDLLRQVAARYGREAREAAKSPYSISSDTPVADSITSNSIYTSVATSGTASISGNGHYSINPIYTGTLGQYTGMTQTILGSAAAVKKAPRVCDELDSLASLSAVEYALDRRPDGINITFAHDKKHPFNLLCAEVHLEAAFRSALQLYLLPYFDRKS